MDKAIENNNQLVALGFLGKATEKTSNGQYNEALYAMFNAQQIIEDLSDVCEYGRDIKIKEIRKDKELLENL